MLHSLVIFAIAAAGDAVTRHSFLKNHHVDVGAAAAHAGKRQVQHQRTPVPEGIVRGPFLGGASFKDSPAAINIWDGRRNPVLRDLEPVAPMDRVDNTEVESFTNAVPLAPGETMSVREVGHAHPDWVPDYLHPNMFPRKEDPSNSWETSNIPMEHRNIYPKADRLRQRGRPDYPLVAPADALAHGRIHPLSPHDDVGDDYAKFIHQVVRQEGKQGEVVASSAAFNCIDIDQDGMISPTEFQAELEGRQNKSGEETQVLWKKFHVAEGLDMARAEYMRLSRSGFDLGQEFINRTDTASVMIPPGGMDLGFWGAGAACPLGRAVTAVRLKVMPWVDGQDNSGLNSVALRCDGGAEIQSIEGPDGEWTEWAECPSGQSVYGAQVYSQAFMSSGDNQAFGSVVFQCRTPSFNESSELVVYNMTSAAEPGGWGPDLTCGDEGLLCGIQARLKFENTNCPVSNATAPKDNMGVTNLRLICCHAPIDCSEVCSLSNGTSSSTSSDCAACQRLSKAQP